jgi:hypothetical protein
MAYIKTADNAGVNGFARVRRSSVPGEAPEANELRAGEVAANTADGTLFVGKVDGNASTVPSIEGANKIVVIEQGVYDALIAATATISTTLYIVTPNPEE